MGCESIEEMVKVQIQGRGIRSRTILNALRGVPRHKFLPPDSVQVAYEDRPLSIGYDQTISQPYIVAYMTGKLRPRPLFRALEIGCGSGYQAAVLSKIVKEVFSVEIVPELAQQAQARMKQEGYDNVHVKQGDGFKGWLGKAPFDIIIVTAAAEEVPPPLLDQLKMGGRLIIPLGSPYEVQTLTLVSKMKRRVKMAPLLPVRFVPFTRKKGDESSATAWRRQIKTFRWRPSFPKDS